MVRVSLRAVTMQIPSQKIITGDKVFIDIAALENKGRRGILKCDGYQGIAGFPICDG